LKTLERALALDANDRVALSDGHDLLVNDGNIDEAAKRAQRLLQLHPSDFLTTWRLVDCLGRMGAAAGDEGRGTKALLRRVGKYHENVFYSRDVLGSYFLARGEERKAAAICRKFLGNYPHCPRAQKSCSRFPAKPEDRSPESAFDAPEGRRLGRCNGACFWNGMVESAEA
jgi:tetratricopeptide (TPR) repeat protein